MSPALSNRILFILSLLGVAVAGYLTLAHLNFVDLGCSAFHGCEDVNKHYTSSGLGIPFLKAVPTAAFGLLMYFVMAGLCVARAGATDGVKSRSLGQYQWLLTVAALLVSAWLTYLEGFVIHAWCQWCVGSAIIVLLMFATATAERMIARPPAEGVAH